MPENDKNRLRKLFDSIYPAKSIKNKLNVIKKSLETSRYNNHQFNIRQHPDLVSHYEEYEKETPLEVKFKNLSIKGKQKRTSIPPDSEFRLVMPIVRKPSSNNSNNSRNSNSSINYGNLFGEESSNGSKQSSKRSSKSIASYNSGSGSSGISSGSGISRISSRGGSSRNRAIVSGSRRRKRNRSSDSNKIVKARNGKYTYLRHEDYANNPSHVNIGGVPVHIYKFATVEGEKQKTPNPIIGKRSVRPMPGLDTPMKRQKVYSNANRRNSTIRSGDRVRVNIEGYTYYGNVTGDTKGVNNVVIVDVIQANINIMVIDEDTIDIGSVINFVAHGRKLKGRVSGIIGNILTVEPGTRQEYIFPTRIVKKIGSLFI